MNEATIVLDFVEVEGIKVSPWGIAKLAKLSPHIEAVVDGLRKRGVTLDALRKGENAEAIKGIIFSVLPECPMILSLSLDLPLQEVEKLSTEKALKLLMEIVNLNLSYLKNWFGPLTEASKKVAGLHR